MGRFFVLMISLVLVSLSTVTAQQPEPTEPTVTDQIAVQWYQDNLLRDAELWHAAATTESGFFRVNLDRRWRPTGQQQATLVSQSRLIVDMVIAFEVTGEQRYLDAAIQGMAFLAEHFADDQHGGWVWAVGPEGRVLDDAKQSYGHAFVILAAASLHRATGDDAYADLGVETMRTVREHLTDSHGGLYVMTQGDWSRPGPARSQNPMMHYFESLLTLTETTGRDDVRAEAQRVLEFFQAHLYRARQHVLPENYGADWRPIRSQQGMVVDVGHQFEWAFLLSEAARLGFEGNLTGIGSRLIDTGLRLGYDDDAGGVYSNAYYGGTTLRRGKVWWPQTEALRAMLRYAVRHERDDLWLRIEQTRQFVDQQFIDHQHGGWYEQLTPQGQPDPDKLHKGTIWKCGYHEMNLYREALQLAAE